MSADDTRTARRSLPARAVRALGVVAGWPARWRDAPAWRAPRRGLSLLVAFAALIVAGSVGHAGVRTAAALADLRAERTWSAFEHRQAALVGVDSDTRTVSVVVDVAGRTHRVELPHGQHLVLGATIDVLVAPDGQRVLLADATRPPAWTSALGALSTDAGSLVLVAAWWVLHRRAAAMAAVESWRERLGVWLAGRWAHGALTAGVLAAAGWTVATVSGSSWAGLASAVTAWGFGAARIATLAGTATILVAGGGWIALWLSAHPSAGGGHLRRAHQVLASSVTPPDDDPHAAPPPVPHRCQQPNAPSA